MTSKDAEYDALPKDSDDVYYSGEGPFDPPDSDSEDDTLLEKGPSTPRNIERGFPSSEEAMASGLVLGGKKRRPASLRYLMMALCGLVLTAVVIGILAAFSYSGTSFQRSSGTKHISMDNVFDGTFYAAKSSVRWVPSAGDGVFATTERSVIKLKDLKTNTTTDLVDLRDIKNDDGASLYVHDWSLSPDAQNLLIKVDRVKQWRHSSFGNYYIYNLTSKEAYPVNPPTHPPVTAYATWSPIGNSVAFVTSNDLYVLPSADPSTKPIRVTSNGNASLYNGVPDWVYEEEVFSSDFALWWSPDAQQLAFLRLDETLVDEYTFPIYNPSEDSSKIYPYTHDVVIKYPKPGYNNPLVSVHVFNLAEYLRLESESESGISTVSPVDAATIELGWEGMQMKNDSIISEIVWVGNQSLIVKETNRGADTGSVVLFDISQDEFVTSSQGKVVRKLGKEGEHGDDGWIEHTQRIVPLPESLSGGVPAYLDIVNNSAGFDHIALFRPVNSSTPIYLTDGNWEVTDGIRAVSASGEIFFTAANPSSTERNVFSVMLPKSDEDLEQEDPQTPSEISALTDVSQPNYFTADFSPGGGFYLLSYDGPNVPWQTMNQVGNHSFEYQITDNARLNRTLAEFQNPMILISTIESDGYELNVREIRPPNFDDSGRTKYPVLFQLYNGPGAQEVDVKFNRGWHHYLACTLKYVVVTVDGRGTGFKGRAFRNPIRGNLGHYEVVDQVNAARIWAAKPYVNRQRIGIWGWSYGGFMSAKVLEAGEGIHTLGISVAPVTSWLLYDSIYTERYMMLPANNLLGYKTSAISNVTAFGEVDYLLAHGSGDDNVHFANSAHLLDMLTQGKVRGFRFRMFTDSDHSISRRGAYRELYEYMTDFLREKWGQGATRRPW